MGNQVAKTTFLATTPPLSCGESEQATPPSHCRSVVDTQAGPPFSTTPQDVHAGLALLVTSYGTQATYAHV